jgi:Spy/CpxP family protein refolding chaperone
MASRLQQLLLGLALSALAAGSMAQTTPNADATGAAPSVPGGPADGDTHRPGWHDEDREDGGRHWHHHHRWGREWHRRHHWGRSEEAMRRPGPYAGGAQALLRSFRALDLTAAQQQQVHTILGKARTQFEAQRVQPETDRLALANPGDPAYASAVQAAKKRAADRIQQESELNQQLYNVLTADQKTQFGKMLSNWKARMAQRSDGPRGQPGPVAR